MSSSTFSYVVNIYPIYFSVANKSSQRRMAGSSAGFQQPPLGLFVKFQVSRVIHSSRHFAERVHCDEQVQRKTRLVLCDWNISIISLNYVHTTSGRDHICWHHRWGITRVPHKFKLILIYQPAKVRARTHTPSLSVGASRQYSPAHVCDE